MPPTRPSLPIRRPAESDRDAAQVDLDAKQAKLAAARLKAIQAGVNPDTDHDVQSAAADVTTAQGTLGTKNTAYTAAMRTDLDTWEAAVPDGTWHLLDDFEEASAVLASLRDTDPNQLVNDVSTTEATLVASQLALYKKSIVNQGVLAVVETSTAVYAAAKGAAAARKFSALRGDS